jgi:TPR repeat protein
MRLVAPILLVLCAAIASTAAAGPFEEGIAAYDKGDFAAALALWRPLAEQGDGAAAFNLAHMYEKGEGTARDEAQAAHWYLEAARKGDADAAFQLGLRYENGVGVDSDPAAAREWYEAVAASPGDDDARVALKNAARARIAALIGATQEIVKYAGGRFVIVRTPRGPCVIAMQGGVSADADYKFDDVVEKAKRMGCEKPWLMLESPGGRLSDGIVLGREIRNAGFRTITRYDCASSCGLIFMGGVERVLAGRRARIGLHEAAVTSVGGRSCVASRASNTSRAIARYLDFVLPKMGESVFDIIMSTSCDAIRWVGAEEALALGIATSLEGEGVDVFGPLSARRASAPTATAPGAPSTPAAAAPPLSPRIAPAPTVAR